MSRTIHPAAAVGFEAAADAYERGRPTYPREAVDVLVEALRISPASTVLDLGAGTGKFTRLLEPTGANLIAIEPVEAMRAKLVERSPSVRVLPGTAEAIPLEPSSADAVVAAQAFHWFEGDRALAEIHRVLKPGGRVGLIWNARDDSVDWSARITEILDSLAADTPRYRTSAWREAFDGRTLFGPLEERAFRLLQETTPEAVLDRIASVSFVASAPPERRAEIMAQVRSLLEWHPDLAGRDEIFLQYRTDVFWCERL